MSSSLLMNIDFEQYLFTDQAYKAKSTKLTQEFEYLLFLLEPQAFVYTSKFYEQKYKDYLSTLRETKCLTTHKESHVELWWGDYSNKETKRLLQNKVETVIFSLKHGLCHKRTSLLGNIENYIDGFLYKTPFEVSGRGIFKAPIKKEHLLKSLRKSAVIQEPLLNRVKDYGTLIHNGRVIHRYENCVDEKFQYKGTLISKVEADFFKQEDIQKAQEKTLEYIKSKDYQGYASIDSFQYEEDGQLKNYYLSEINARKSMGYIASRLKELFFTDKKFFKFGITKGNVDLQGKTIGNEAYILSPNGNLFHTYMIGADSQEDIIEKEKILLSSLT